MAHRPNLLIVLASGLRSDALGDARRWPLHTPRLARLAGRGLRVVAASACPEPGGGMASLLTGLHPRQGGGGDTFAHWLKDAGYHIAGAGVVAAIAAACDDAVIVEPTDVVKPDACAYARHAAGAGLLPAIVAQRKQRRRHGPFEPDRLLLEPEDDIDGYIAAQARAAVARMPRDRPWALVTIFSGPGNDLPPPPPYDEVVDARAVRTAFAPADFRRLDAVAQPAYPRSKLQRLEPGSLARIRADYLGRVALIDHGIGGIAEAASRRRDRTRTWTLVAADHGYLLGEHGLVGPRSFLAGAVETPLVVAPPRGYGVPEEGCDDLVSTVDLAATIAALAGVDLPSACAGRSLLPMLRDEARSGTQQAVLSEFDDRLMLETERHKAIFDARGELLGLLDLLDDPEERRVMTDAKAGAMLVDALRARLARVLIGMRAAR